MQQLNIHNQFNVPIIAKLNEAYKLWHSYLVNLPRITRYTLGEKIDNQFTDCLELALLAGYQSKNKKLETGFVA
ncbi:TPA: hypothetical protein DDY56_02400 [Candidatus Uhrbacteria bacterium]|nr:MAG: hypothetical protein A2258_00830 [Candidatus Uhrbacteria bacterium RIFOXYA2_FULL_41_8]HAL49769.1 hypothetical protein [Candidatus Uhrbacteria bacterium]HAN06140.1 hypothetical protein [Candidatus Uhrbacteria bacterium]HAP65633.1 hypothetical protein [Candidatus Uhrbacteria bacterium]HBA51735.1 hypothetical protein [Candidatus Uhrbacteria bacterium]